MPWAEWLKRCGFFLAACLLYPIWGCICAYAWVMERLGIEHGIESEMFTKEQRERMRQEKRLRKLGE